MSFLNGIIPYQQQNTIEYNESNKFDGVSVENPTNKKLPVAIILDTSGSMDSKMKELSNCLNGFINTIKNDDNLNLNVELCVITFGTKATTKISFSTAHHIENLNLRADGTTSMYEAINLAITEIDSHKKNHKTIGIDYSRPLTFLLTDGSPTDMSLNCPKFNQLKSKLAEDERNNHYSFLPIGVTGCDYGFLNALSPNNKALELVNADFKKLFVWLQNSMELIIDANNNNEEEITLPDPTQGKFAWGKFKL
jgi:uncharacterized protein YegL